jgi:threonine/homoserine/homoserine lactone efflux protein
VTGLAGFLASAFAISLTGAMSPGPLTTLAITAGARRGRWAGWWISAGHGLVEGSLVVAIGLGLGSVLEQPTVGAIIGVGGGLAIFYLVHWLTDVVWLNLMSFLTGSGRGLMNERIYRGVLMACGLFLSGFSVYFVVSGLRFVM